MSNAEYDKNLTGFEPEWSVPDNIHSWVTTRAAGNMATHAGPQQDVEYSRKRLEDTLPSKPHWLNQIHKDRVIELPTDIHTPAVDGSWTNKRNTVCVVLSADCLPVLLCNSSGTAVAALHAGWKGLAAGVLKRGVEVIREESGSADVIAWLGPAIEQSAYEVDIKVRDALCRNNVEAEEMFLETTPGHWLCSLEGIARLQLEQMGVNDICDKGWNRYNGNENKDSQFFSYRQDLYKQSEERGRFATLVWME